MSGLVDRNWMPFGISDSGRTITPAEWQAPPPELMPDLDDLFKCSGTSNLTAQDLVIPASVNEDSIDCTRGANYRWLRCIVQGSVTLKGAIQKWLFQDSTVDGNIEVGQFDNYWYPGRIPTAGGVIANTKTSTGAKVKVTLWDAEKPLVLNSDVEFIVKPKWMWLPFFLSQYVWVRIVNLFLPPEKKHLTK